MATHPEQLLDVWLHSVEHVAKQYEQARRRHSLLLAELQEHQETADRIDLALLGKDGEEERHARPRAKVQAEMDATRAMIAEAEQEMAAYAAMPGAYGFGNIAARMTEIADMVGVAEAKRILKAALEKTLGAQTRAKLDAMDVDERRRRIKTLVEKIVVNDDGAYMVAAIPGASGALCMGGRDGADALHVHVVEP